MVATFAIITKELRLLLRDPGGLLMLFVLPAVFIIALSVALQGAFAPSRDEDRLQLFVANRDRGDHGEQMISQLREKAMFNLHVHPSRDGGREAGLEGLAQGRYDAVVLIPSKTSRAIALEEEAEVEVIFDPVSTLEVSYGIQAAVQALTCSATIGELLSQSGMETEEEVPLEEMDVGLRVTRRFVSRGEEVSQPNVVQQNVPGWTIFALFWMAQILALNILTERSSGINVRLVAAPVSTVSYLTGKLVPFFVINLLQAVAMFAVGMFVLPLLGCPELVLVNLPALALLTVTISLVSMSLGLMFAALSDSTIVVATSSAVTLIIMAVLGGIMVPKFVMPEMMQKLSLVVPHGWALDGYHAVLVQGAELKDILPNAGALLAFALLPFCIAAWRIRARFV